MDYITGILSAIRTEIVDIVKLKKANLNLNFGFGTLHLGSGGTVEFKSNLQFVKGETDADNIPVINELDKITTSKRPESQSISKRSNCEVLSRISNTDRSLNFM